MPCSASELYPKSNKPPKHENCRPLDSNPKAPGAILYGDGGATFSWSDSQSSHLVDSLPHALPGFSECVRRNPQNLKA